MDLTDVATLKSLLKRHGLNPTKALGQHYLISNKVVEAICEAAVFEHPQAILEIGPGPGVLTNRLSSRVPKLQAVEIDPTAISALSESAPNVDVISSDVLKLDIEKLLEDLPGPRVVVSNMPYQITGPLLSRVCNARRAYSKAILMMQREVGDRINSAPGSSDCGSISILLQTRMTIRTVIQAPAGAFYPPPKVDSIVLEFVPNDRLQDRHIDAFHEQMVRSAFVQPRKTLVNNLRSFATSRGLDLVGSMAELSLEPQIRPHQVPLESWLRLAELWRPHNSN